MACFFFPYFFEEGGNANDGECMLFLCLVFLFCSRDMMGGGLDGGDVICLDTSLMKSACVASRRVFGDIFLSFLSGAPARWVYQCCRALQLYGTRRPRGDGMGWDVGEGGFEGKMCNLPNEIGLMGEFSFVGYWEMG